MNAPINRDDFTRQIFDWLRQVNLDGELSALSLRIAFVICQSINRTSGEAWPTQETIAGELGASVRGVRKAIDHLVERRHLSKSPGAHKRAPNRYRLSYFDRNHSSPQRPVCEEPQFPSTPDLRGTPEQFERNNRVDLTGTTVPPEPSERTIREPERAATAISRRERAVEWPADFLLDDDMLAFAEKHGFPSIRAKSMFAKFQAHAETHDRRCVNWRAAWRNWVLQEQPKGATATRPSNPLPSAFNLSKPAARA